MVVGGTNDSGTDIAKKLGRTFDSVTGSGPLKRVGKAVDAVKSRVSPKQDTSWHDSMVKKANDSFRKPAAKKAVRKPAPKRR